MKFLTGLLLLASCAMHLDAQVRNAAQISTQLAAQDSAGVLRPGDIVRLRIWREPDLSGDFIVDQGGQVVFPKIGPRHVAGESPSSLKDSLVKSYQIYLRNPSIEITLLRRVNVLGAVRSPGLYPVDPTMTLADVVAAAGGASPQGKTDQVELLRDGKTVTANLTGGVRVGDLQIRSGDQIYVPERSWASRNSGVVAAALTASVSLIIAMVR
jgi:protein involved in polysaccharide export with SLBB domain